MTHAERGEVVQYRLDIFVLTDAKPLHAADGAAHRCTQARSGLLRRLLWLVAHTVSPRRCNSLLACSTRSSAVCSASHGASWRTPSSKVTRGRKTSSSPARVMSAKQLRMSPLRYCPVMRGLLSWSLVCVACCASSAIAQSCPLPML